MYKLAKLDLTWAGLSQNSEACADSGKRQLSPSMSTSFMAGTSDVTSCASMLVGAMSVIACKSGEAQCLLLKR